MPQAPPRTPHLNDRKANSRRRVVVRILLRFPIEERRWRDVQDIWPQARYGHCSRSLHLGRSRGRRDHTQSRAARKRAWRHLVGKPDRGELVVFVERVHPEPRPTDPLRRHSQQVPNSCANHHETRPYSSASGCRDCRGTYRSQSSYRSLTVSATAPGRAVSVVRHFARIADVADGLRLALDVPSYRTLPMTVE